MHHIATGRASGLPKNIKLGAYLMCNNEKTSLKMSHTSAVAQCHVRDSMLPVTSRLYPGSSKKKVIKLTATWYFT